MLRRVSKRVVIKLFFSSVTAALVLTVGQVGVFAQGSDPGSGAEVEASQPLDLDIKERVDAQLGSIRVTMQALAASKLKRKDRQAMEKDPEFAERMARILDDLKPEDLRLRVGLNVVDVESIDPICSVNLAERWEIEGAAERPSTIAEQAAEIYSERPVMFTYYLDRNYMTMTGFQAALDQVEKMVQELPRPEDYVALVISSIHHRTYVQLTRNKRKLIDTVREIRADTRNPEFAIVPADAVIRQRMEAIQLSAEPADVAVSMARIDDNDTVNALERLRFTIKAMENPTVEDEFRDRLLVYFADLNRGALAGQIYLQAFGAPDRGIPLSQFELDRVTRDATAAGVRLYTVQPHGQAPLSAMTRARISGGTGNNFSSTRIADQVSIQGRSSLQAMASETGGKWFVAGGAGVEKVMKGLEEDLNCTMFVNFRIPESMQRDQPLPVELNWKESPVPRLFNVKSQGQFVISSEDTKEVNKLLAQVTGFTDDTENTADVEALYTVVRPRKFDGKKLTLEIQHVVDVSRAAPHFMQTSDGLAFDGAPGEIPWQFEHMVRMPADRIKRQPPVTVRANDAGRIVLLRQHQIDFSDQDRTDPVSVIASARVEDTSYRSLRREGMVDVPTIEVEGRKVKANLSEPPVPGLVFVQGWSNEEAELLAIGKSASRRLPYAMVGAPEVSKGVPGEADEVDVAIVDPSRDLYAEILVCRSRDKANVSYKVEINGQAMGGEPIIAASNNDSKARTGSIDLGKQACQVHLEPVFSADQMSNLDALKGNDIHRYDVGIYQGDREAYRIRRYFKIRQSDVGRVDQLPVAGSEASEAKPVVTNNR